MTQPLEKTALAPMPEEGALASLVGMKRDVLEQKLVALGLEKFRAKQIWKWVYVHGATDFAQMTDIAKPAREILAQHFFIPRATIDKDLVSFDGTRKWLLKFADGNQVETVFIPEEDRGTLCISSQVGCTLACTFCHTGTQKLVRNLSAAEIVGQALTALDGLKEWGKNDDKRRISNIVFMGMGEPMFNYDHMADAIKLLLDENGLAFSRRKVTVSTSGVVPRIYDLTENLGVNLAISLHATNDTLRDEIVPINRKYKLAELMEACRHFTQTHKSRRIMFEYVMLAGVNDSDADAEALAALLKGIPSKVNLIPFNPWPGSPYTCSSNNRIHTFKRVLQAHHLSTPIRKTRGQDILAACGQLKSESERKKGEKVKLK